MDEAGGWSNLIGPEAEWCAWPNAESHHTELSMFWWIVEGIVVSFPGSYDLLPWEYTEKALALLMKQ